MRSIGVELHRLFNNLRRYKFPFTEIEKSIPKNGVYLLFEKGEIIGEYDRIVRVGSHSGTNQLLNRLYDHYIRENKNRSIFRKNIGRCFLKKEKNEYLKYWEYDTTSVVNQGKFSHLLNPIFESQLEKRISDFIQTNLSFSVFKIDDKDERLYWEKKIIASLAQSSDIKPSESWLGLHSPKEKIRLSGLWQVNELAGKRLTQLEVEELEVRINDKF
ncbi:MAG: hypothetical protein ACTHJ5_10170 [Ilyomonas sp.]